jgi:hypothetical protein
MVVLTDQQHEGAPPVTELTTVVDTYLEAWSEPDADRRAKLIADTWVADGRIVDPPLTGEGHTGIDELLQAFQTHYAGHSFRRVSGIDSHHEYLRFAWEMVGPDGTVAVTGLDVGELAADGRLARITGFFGPLPDA